MLLRRLEITNVRSIRAASLDDLGRVNVFYGDNGSGKTSVLEAVYMLSQARSFRGHRTDPMITLGEEYSLCFGELVSDGQMEPVGVRRGRREPLQIRRGGRTLQAVHELSRIFPVQVLCSESFGLLEGGPEVRRRFLDWGVFHVEHRFFETWRAVQRSLQQRNEALRQGQQGGDDLLRPWNEELARHGELLSSYREAYFDRLAEAFSGIWVQLSDLDGLDLQFYRGWDREKPLLQALNEHGPRDRELGYTVTGAHRADLRIRLHGKPAVEILSRGQQKLVVSALRIAQAQVVQQATGRPTVFLADDLPAELDRVHRRKVCELFSSLGSQVFMTAVSFDDLTDCWHQTTDLRLFHVEHGQIRREH